MSIPYLLHQTWKTESVPDHLLAYVHTWQELHPGWSYTLWTDEMNRNFIAAHYPYFLPIYDQYPSAIQRVDAVRYFILLRHGGVFVDLDFQCLKNITPLLSNAQFIAGKEPQEHALWHLKPYIISNAFMAATPGNVFLKKVCSVLKENNYYRYAHEPGFNAVLDCAGPFMLSRIYEGFEDKQHITILEHELLYPLTKEKATGRISAYDAAKAVSLKQAYAIHHYWGSWWH